MIKKIFLLTIALLCAVAQGAWAESVTFRVRSWDDNNKQVVTTTETHDATVLEGIHKDDWIGLGNGYYLVNSDTEYEVLNIMGDVHLILSGNATLACKHVKLEGENKLHIHNIADDNTGTLKVTNSRILRRAVGGNKTKSCVHHYLYGEYDEAAALGGGGNQNMGSLYVHGGAVSVLQSGGGAAIGGGKNASIGGEVVVYAGTVEAHSKSSHMSGAAIGGGKGYSQGGPVTIYGGKVKAFVNETLNDANNGAGIGGGANGGGHGGTVTIWGGEVLAIGGKEATGIGGGYKGAGGDVHIYGGTVEARGGEKSSAIGAYDDYKLGTVGFSDNMRVKGGTAARGAEDYELTPTIERVFTTGEREAACQWRRWVKIEACEHTTPTEAMGSDHTEPFYYTIDDDATHTKHCRYCNTTWSENHSAENCVCGRAGNKYQFTVYVPGANKDEYNESTTTTVGAGKTFLLPPCSVVPKGYTFAGWKMNPEPDDNKWAYVKAGDASGDLIQPQESVEAVAGMDNAKFYARFLYLFNPTWEWAADGSTAQVTLKHKDLSDVTLSSTDDDPKVVITPAVLKNTGTDTETNEEVEWTIGTRFTATCTYTLDGNKYTFSDTHDVMDVIEVEDIPLIDNADNSAIINKNYDCPVNATLQGRTLYKDGSWNTLCLPFDVDDISGTSLAGATVKTLESSDYDSETGALTLNFTTNSLTSLKAGTPYLVKWESGSGTVDAPTFSGVTISATEGSSESSMYVDFVGSFSPVALTANDKTVLYLGAGNKLYYPSQNRTMGSCRAVFRLHNGLTAGDLPTQASRFVLNFGEDEATGIISVHDSGFMVNGSDAWYTLDGRRLSGKPTQKGIYINNSKKVVIK